MGGSPFTESSVLESKQYAQPFGNLMGAYFKSDNPTGTRAMNTENTGKVPKTAKRPQPKGGSRKGIPNKNTGLIREMIAQALDEAGGVDYLVACAQDPRSKAAFLGLIGKVMPVQISGEGGGPVLNEIVIKVVDADRG